MTTLSEKSVNLSTYTTSCLKHHNARLPCWYRSNQCGSSWQSHWEKPIIWEYNLYCFYGNPIDIEIVGRATFGYTIGKQRQVVPPS